MWKRVTIALLGATLLAASAAAQTVLVTNDGAFAALSPGNQKIAMALFEAQPRSPHVARLSRDDIAAMKQSGRGWGEVFKQMKADGLVRERNLGQVVSAASKHDANVPFRSTGPVITTARGTTVSGAHRVDGGPGVANGHTASGTVTGGSGQSEAAGGQGAFSASSHGGGQAGNAAHGHGR